MTNETEDRAWHPEVIGASTADTLRQLRAAPLAETFYLAGGTGLALQLGHRISHDLDFFSPDLFDEELLLQSIQTLPEFSLSSKAPHTLHATAQGTKVSFLGYVYPILFPFVRFMNVPVADARDIACMKISAIAGRGTRRDFVDLHVLAQHFGLGELLQLFERKYARAGYSRVHVLKSLTYFEDAEKDPMPNMLIPVAWDAVKRTLLGEVPKLLG